MIANPCIDSILGRTDTHASAYHPRQMWRFYNSFLNPMLHKRIARPLRAAIVATALAAPISGYQPVAAAQAAPDPSAIDAPLLDATHARRVHQLVSDWVRAAAVPADNLPALSATGAIGLRVTLRLDGIEVGAGEALRPDINQTRGGLGPAVDLAPLAAQATRQALEQVTGSLHDAYLRAAVAAQGAAAEKLEPARLADIVHRLLVDVQVGHRLEPMRVPTDAPATAVLERFAPGFHGLRVPGPATADTTVWSATALARNVSPRGQVAGLLVAAGADGTRLDLLGRAGGLELQRFQVIHIVQPAPGLPVMELTRGQAILPLYSLDERTLAGLGERLAQHLTQRLTDQGLVRGTYHPTSDRYAPAIATDEEAALAAYALATFHAAQGDAPSAAQPQRVATRIARNSIAAGDKADIAAASLALLTLIEDSAGETRDMRDRLGALLVSRWRGKEHGFARSGEPDAPGAPGASQALATAALAALYEQTRGAGAGEVAWQAMDRVWADAQRQTDVASLPWLMRAHTQAAHLLAVGDDERQATLQRRARSFGDIVRNLVDQQIAAAPAAGPADIVGGFQLDPLPPGGLPSADWRSAQVMRTLAWALRSEDVRDGRDEMGWLLSAGLAGRFIGQLMMDEPGAYYTRNPREALGGLRLAPWDNRMAIGPQALALLAVVELQTALQAMSR